MTNFTENFGFSGGSKKLIACGVYIFWIFTHTLLLVTVSGQQWFLTTPSNHTEIGFQSITSPFGRDKLQGKNAGTAALLVICVLISSIALIVDRFICAESHKKLLHAILSFSLILNGVLLLVAMSVYTGSYKGADWASTYEKFLQSQLI